MAAASSSRAVRLSRVRVRVRLALGLPLTLTLTLPLTLTLGEKHAAGMQPNSFDVIGKNKCCWSRTAPILYSNATLDCPNKEPPGARG